MLSFMRKRFPPLPLLRNLLNRICIDRFIGVMRIHYKHAWIRDSFLLMSHEMTSTFRSEYR